MANTSETNWDNVNRYCGELLAGAPVEYAGYWYANMRTQSVSWQANKENTIATLEKSTHRFGLVVEKTYHFLRLLTDEAGSSERSEYVITFNPGKQNISRAASQPEFEPPYAEPGAAAGGWQALRGLFAYIGARRRINEAIERLGACTPSEDDYALLQSELQRGVTELRA